MTLHRCSDRDSGVTWYRFAQPDSGFRHALITRLGGVSSSPYSSLNLGGTVGDDAKDVRENHRRAFAALDISETQVISPHQVHGAKVAEVGVRDAGKVIPDTDALITREQGVALLLRFADCVPVLFYDPVHRVAGLAHAGWRGVAAGVAPITVQAMMRRYGARPEDVWAGVGPSIGQHHYRVGVEVVDAVCATLPAEASVALKKDGSWYLDLPGAVFAQLRAVGVRQVELSDICTACRTDEWYSHRAESGTTGRFGVLAMLI
ncbi:MAG: peptidoglycan editing factor PgeF [Anaerolineae bacterium]